VAQGSSVTDLFTFNTGGSFHGPVTLSISGLPSTVTASWSNTTFAPAPGTATSTSTLTLSPTASAVPNWYFYTVTASGDGLSVSKQYTVVVAYAVGFQTLLSQSALTIQPQGTATLVVTADPIHTTTIGAGAAGCAASVVSGLPAGVTASWSSPTMTPDNSVHWTLTLTATGAAISGSYPVVIATQITDQNTGLVYANSSSVNLLVALLANVSIGSTPGTSISPSFLGLSHEWNDAPINMMGYSAIGVNPIYRQLLTNLTTYGGSPINIRIGGNSTDGTGEPTSTTVEPFVELANALGAQFELGVNLGSDNVQLATDQAANYSAKMPAGSLLALEIGNEPDEYSKNGSRPSNYSLQNYYTDFNTWANSIMPVIPAGLQLMGPSWAFYSNEQQNLGSFESEFSNVLATFSLHSYATSPGNNPAVDFLLTPAAATTLPAAVASGVALSHANGIPFRMGEIGAASDGGIPSVGGTFASALWSIDIMFNYANVGVDGVNWLTGTNDSDAAFGFTHTTTKGINTYTLSAVNPLYYGFLFFEIALGDGAQFLPVTLNTPANLTAWATLPTGRNPRVAIINKDETLSGTVAVTMPGYSQASVLYLTAPSYTSTHGITLAGQTFDGSTTGNIQGTKTPVTLSGVNGVFQVPMLTTSAALVIFTQ
jgi:hypothetical protein